MQPVLDIKVRFSQSNNRNKGKVFQLKSTNKTSLRSLHQHRRSESASKHIHNLPTSIIRIRCRRLVVGLFGKPSKIPPTSVVQRVSECDCYTFVWFFYSLLFRQKKTQRKSKRKQPANQQNSTRRNKSSVGGITKT